MVTENNAVSVREKISYGLGDTASNLFFQTFMIYLLFFYTDVFGITAAAAGTMLLVTRLWDTFNDPIVGVLADRTNSRWGKFRPYILWGAVPFGLAGVLTFTTPDLEPLPKLVYAYITYGVMMMLYTVVNIPYSALMGVISSDSLVRTSVSSYRFIFAFLGGLVVQATTLPLVEYLGGDDQQLGFQLTMSIFAVVAVVLFFVTFANTRERVAVVVESKSSLKNDLQDLMTNIPWLVLFAVGLFNLTFTSIRSGTVIYYFKYIVGDEALASGFLVAGTLATLAGVAAAPLLTKWLGKKRLFIIATTASALLTTLFYLINPDNYTALMALQLAASLLAGPTAPIVWAMYADCADYSAYHNKRRATGLVFSAATFAQKMGWTLGGAATGWLLAWYGFEANVTQTEDAMHGIKLMFSVIPGVIGFAAAAVMMFYPLDDDEVQRISIEMSDSPA